jgi:hypothetical protein
MREETGDSFPIATKHKNFADIFKNIKNEKLFVRKSQFNIIHLNI